LPGECVHREVKFGGPVSVVRCGSGAAQQSWPDSVDVVPLAGAVKGLHEGFERVTEAVGALVSGALVAADPPSAGATVPGAAFSGWGQVLAEKPQVLAIEDADGGGEE
jgi:hypothetical protein